MEVTIWSGLVLGSIYALVATGFNIAIVPTGIFNFAEGAIVVLGTFMVYEFLTVLTIPTAWAIALTAVTGGVAGIMCELLTVRSLRWRGGSVDNVLVTTVGAATALAGFLGVKWGYVTLLIPSVTSANYFHVLGINVRPVEVTTVGVGIFSALLLEILFRFTRRGQACLAVREDRDAAMLRGVNVSALSLVAFMGAGVFGGLVGLLIGPITFGIPTYATTLALYGFVAVALGGEGSFIGGLIGGLVVGMVSTFAVRYFGANYGDIAVLALLLGALGFRPKGIRGGAAVRVV